MLRLRDELGLDNVVMLEQQPKHLMPSLWALSCVSLIVLRKAELFKTVIPSKLFESMAMEKPVILGVEGESAEIVRSAQAGFSIEPENAQELAASLLKLYRNADLCATLGANGRRHVIEHFDRSVLAKQFQVVLHAACDSVAA